MDKSDIQKWIDNIYYEIAGYANSKQQYLSWNGLSSKYASSFDEMNMMLYDSFCFDDFIKANESLIKVESTLYNALRLFDFQLNEYFVYVKEHDSERNIPSVILSDPKWHEIQQMAAKIVALWDENPPKVL